VSENKHETVAAVVVTYNRKELLRQCLGGILAQTRPVDAIYVVDNASTDGTDQMIAAEYADRVIYERLPENTGGAAGFHHGMKRAYEDGHDWIWVMDDDAEPQPHCLEYLLKHAGPDVGYLAPLILGGDGRLQSYHHKRLSKRLFTSEVSPARWQCWRTGVPSSPVRIDANAFVGPLINARFLSSVGLPNAGFFITWDDTEFTYRLSRRGKCFLIPEAIIVHKDSQVGAVPRGGGPRMYYSYRNQVLFVRLVDGHFASWLCAAHLLASMVCHGLRRLLTTRSATRPTDTTPTPPESRWHGSALVLLRALLDGVLNRCGPWHVKTAGKR